MNHRFTDVRPLATGGMALVEQATMHGPRGFEKQVVRKRLRPELIEQPELVRAFAAEARLGARFDHPNIAHIYQLLDDDGELVVVMELVRGWPLGELLATARARGTPLPLDAAGAIGFAVAVALHHVHELEDDGRPLGVVHRDVSPSNVMVTGEGGVKLLDFGIAKAASGGERTQIGLVKGTTAHMSPEQCLQGSLDRRSDVFALGILLYEMVTLTAPFARAGDGDQTVMERIVGGRCAPPSSLAPACAGELEAVILRALAPARELRFATALELAGALEQAAIGHGVPLSPLAVARTVGELLPAPGPARFDPDATQIGRLSADRSGDGDRTDVDRAPIADVSTQIIDRRHDSRADD